MTGIRIVALAGAIGMALATAAGAEELRLAHWVPPQHPLQPTGLVPWGQLDRGGLRRAAHHHHLPRAAAGRRGRSLRHGARRHRRHRVRQSGLSGGPLPDHRPRRDPVSTSPTPRAARRRSMPGTATTPRGDGRRQVLHGVPALARHLPLEGQADPCPRTCRARTSGRRRRPSDASSACWAGRASGCRHRKRARHWPAARRMRSPSRGTRSTSSASTASPRTISTSRSTSRPSCWS